jgi:hypothetical protein
LSKNVRSWLPSRRRTTNCRGGNSAATPFCSGAILIVRSSATLPRLWQRALVHRTDRDRAPAGGRRRQVNGLRVTRAARKVFARHDAARSDWHLATLTVQARPGLARLSEGDQTRRSPGHPDRVSLNRRMLRATQFALPGGHANLRQTRVMLGQCFFIRVDEDFVRWGHHLLANAHPLLPRGLRQQTCQVVRMSVFQ